MARGLGLAAVPREHPLGAIRTLIKETFMQWQTPTATDLRFGFEITLYVAAR